MGIEAGGAPTDLPDFGEIGVGRLEGGQLFEGIRGEVGGEGFQLQGFVGGLDIEVKIAPGAPPERLEGAMLAAVGKEAVDQADGLAIVRLRRGRLFAGLVVEGFRVGERDRAPLPPETVSSG